MKYLFLILFICLFGCGERKSSPCKYVCSKEVEEKVERYLMACLRGGKQWSENCEIDAEQRYCVLKCK